MRILKCYLANNTRNQFVNAKEAAKAGDGAGNWTCASCGCELLLRIGVPGEAPGLSTYGIPFPINGL